MRETSLSARLTIQCRAMPLFFFLKMEQAGVVPIISLAEELNKTLVYVSSIELCMEPAVF